MSLRKSTYIKQRMTRYFSTFIKINKKKYLYMHLGIKNDDENKQAP